MLTLKTSFENDAVSVLNLRVLVNILTKQGKISKAIVVDLISYMKDLNLEGELEINVREQVRLVYPDLDFWLNNTKVEIDNVKECIDCGRKRLFMYEEVHVKEEEVKLMRRVKKIKNVNPYDVSRQSVEELEEESEEESDSSRSSESERIETPIILDTIVEAEPIEDFELVESIVSETNETNETDDVQDVCSRHPMRVVSRLNFVKARRRRSNAGVTRVLKHVEGGGVEWIDLIVIIEEKEKEENELRDKVGSVLNEIVSALDAIEEAEREEDRFIKEKEEEEERIQKEEEDSNNSSVSSSSSSNSSQSKPSTPSPQLVKRKPKMKKKKITPKQKKALKLAKAFGIKKPILPVTPPSKVEPSVKPSTTSMSMSISVPPPPSFSLKSPIKKTTFATMSMMNVTPVRTKKGVLNEEEKREEEEEKRGERKKERHEQKKKKLFEMTPDERRMHHYKKEWKKTPNKVIDQIFAHHAHVVDDVEADMTSPQKQEKRASVVIPAVTRNRSKTIGTTSEIRDKDIKQESKTSSMRNVRPSMVNVTKAGSIGRNKSSSMYGARSSFGFRRKTKVKGLYTPNPLVDYDKKYDLTSPVKDAVAGAEFVHSVARGIELRFREMREREEKEQEEDETKKQEMEEEHFLHEHVEELTEESDLSDAESDGEKNANATNNAQLLHHPSAADLKELQKLQKDESKEMAKSMKNLLLKTRRSEKNLKKMEKKSSRMLLSPENKSPKNDDVRRNLFGEVKNHGSSVRSLLSASRATG
ncbi:hypothetical protein TrLO_g12001 [Triparma laevis f. longispina]|uniref:Uncharacterized protein n=1 Tax=Triparma laevis f. longispina TaxID=1714387 RepID=A0A9W7F7L9_9STRA|nr:hypothetical protein TrLO_g12001 [Triparma laevis f. longispina]